MGPKAAIPKCRGNNCQCWQYPNQFQKWSSWVTPKVINLREAGTPEWEQTGQLFLECDKIDEFGPETMKFTNVPPGWYQVVVFLWDPKKGPDNLGENSPSVRFWLPDDTGDEEIPIICEMDPQCAAAPGQMQSESGRFDPVQRVWLAAMVEVRQSETYPDITEVRVHDGRANDGEIWKQKPILEEELPSWPSTYAESRGTSDSGWFGGRFGPDHDRFKADRKVTKVSQRVLDRACKSVCTIQDPKMAQEQHYANCLASSR